MSPDASPAAAPVEAEAAQPAPVASTTPAPPSVSGDPGIESRRQAAFEAVQAEVKTGRAATPDADAESGEQPTEPARKTAAERAEATTTEDDSAAPEAVSEASADTGTPSATDAGPRVRFEDLSRTDKAKLLAELRPMMAEVQADNERLRTEQERTKAAQQADAAGFYDFFGMDEQGTDRPYLETVQRAEQGDWDAIQRRADLESRRRFGMSAIQKANEGAWSRLEGAMQVAREIGGPAISPAIDSQDLGQVFRAIQATTAADEQQKWQGKEAELTKAHKAEIARLNQEHKTKLARAVGELPDAASPGGPGSAPGALVTAMRGTPEDREKLRESIRRGELRNLQLTG